MIRRVNDRVETSGTIENDLGNGTTGHYPISVNRGQLTVPSIIICSSDLHEGRMFPKPRCYMYMGKAKGTICNIIYRDYLQVVRK